MKITLSVFPIIFILATFVSHQSFSAENLHKHGESKAKLSLDSGDKWPIDKSLHSGMTNIKNEIAKNLDTMHHEQFTDKQYIALATSLNKQLSYIFKNCKLPPLADAQLHTLLSRIMMGIDKMEHSSNKRQGAILIIQSLYDYPVFFEDPNWQNLTH